MSEEQKRIRIELTFAGIERLYNTPNTPRSRKDFFAAPGRPEDYSAGRKLAYLKEMQAKPWQQAVLKRLVEAEIIRATSEFEQLYIIGDEARANLVISDHEKGGLILSHFVFPNEVPKPSFADSPVVLATFQEDTQIQLTPPGPNLLRHSGTEAQVALTPEELLQKLLESVVKSNEQNLKFQTNFIGSMEAMNSTFGLISDICKEQTNTISGLKNSMITLENKVNGLAKDVSKLDDSVKATKNVADANQATTKKLSYSLESVEKMSSQISELVHSSSSLNSDVGNMVKEMRSKNNLSVLGARLAALSEENKNLSELILGATGES